MGLTALFNEPFFTGTTATSNEVPGLYPVGLNGRGFLLDLASNEFRHVTVPLLRDQADQSDRPGATSINPDDLWRRVAATWHRGAGQRNFDSADSDGARFHTSKGIDPWTEGQISLLPAVDEKKASANSNLQLAVAGTYLYLIDGTSIQYTQDVTVDSPTWSDITGEPATAPTAITSDGYSVYTAHGSDGVYVTTRGGASTASGVTGTVTGLKWIKGRLFGWSGNDIYNITSVDTGTPAALPTALLEHVNTDFAWVDVAEAAGFYFLAGFSGDKTLIYQTAVKADGTALETPTVAAELPDGEIVRAVQGYLGFILIGTDKGVRFGQPDSSGNLTLGALIDEATEVRCFEGQGRFVWFGWSQFDATSTGLGRLDLSQFNGTTPAFASDLMATENGDVLSIATFQGIRVFTVSGDGVFAEDTDLVASGTLTTGRISYGIYDPKVSMFVTVNHEPLAGSVAMAMARDGGDFASVGVANASANTVASSFATGRARAERFDLQVTLTRDATDTTTGPTVGRLTLRAYPSAQRSSRILVPLLLGKKQKLANGASHSRSVLDDLDYLAALEDGAPVSYQEGSATHTVVVEEHEWRPHHLEDDRHAFNGTYLIQLKKFASE